MLKDTLAFCNQEKSFVLKLVDPHECAGRTSVFAIKMLCSNATKTLANIAALHQREMMRSSSSIKRAYIYGEDLSRLHT